MSQDISNLQVQSFGQNFYTNVELAGGLLRPHMTIVGSQFGTMPYRESGIYPVFQGGGRPTEELTRFGKTPISEADYENRKIARKFYSDGFFIDWKDVETIAVDLKHPKMMNSVYKFQREEDITAIDALLGVAQGGNLGATDVAFDTDNVVPVTTGATSGNAGMTYEKFLVLKESLSLANVDIQYGVKPVIVMSPTQYYNDLYQDERFINSSYYQFATAQAAQSTKSFMDCTIVVMNNTPWMNTAGTGASIGSTGFSTTGDSVDVDSTDIRACFAFMPDAAMLEISPDVESAIAPDITRGNNPLAYLKMGVGAVRMEEAKVWLVPCDESPA
jgi:hypothetical protein